MNLWQTTAGSGTVNTITIVDGDGNPLVMTGDEELVCEVWHGGDQAPLFEVTPTANDPDVGTWDIAITGANTADLTPGRYDVLVKYADGTADCYYGALEILQAPGVGTPGKVYASYQDLLRVAAWAKDVQSADDEATFLAQRVDARLWLDDIILKSYRGGTGASYEMSIAAQSWAGGAGGGGQRRSLIPSQWLRDQLEADRLLLRPEVIKAVSYKAASDVGLNQIGFNAKIAARGAWCLQMAEAIASNLIAEIDTDDDGRADVAIPIVASNTLYT